jgi:hypothetical protein
MQANAAVDRELRGEALEDLCERVDDWKNHQVDQFGDLLLHGVFTVLTGKSDQEKEVSFPSTGQPRHGLGQINPTAHRADEFGPRPPNRRAVYDISF